MLLMKRKDSAIAGLTAATNGRAIGDATFFYQHGEVLLLVLTSIAGMVYGKHHGVSFYPCCNVAHFVNYKIRV